MDIFSLISLLQYLLIGIGILGVIILFVGLQKGNPETIRRGAYLIIIAIVVSICSYLVARKTEEHIQDYVPDYIEESGYY